MRVIWEFGRVSYNIQSLEWLWRAHGVLLNNYDKSFFYDGLDVIQQSANSSLAKEVNQQKVKKACGAVFCN